MGFEVAENVWRHCPWLGQWIAVPTWKMIKTASDVSEVRRLARFGDDDEQATPLQVNFIPRALGLR